MSWMRDCKNPAPHEAHNYMKTWAKSEFNEADVPPGVYNSWPLTWNAAYRCPGRVAAIERPANGYELDPAGWEPLKPSWGNEQVAEALTESRNEVDAYLLRFFGSFEAAQKHADDYVLEADTQWAFRAVNSGQIAWRDMSFADDQDISMKLTTTYRMRLKRDDER